MGRSLGHSSEDKGVCFWKAIKMTLFKKYQQYLLANKSFVGCSEIKLPCLNSIVVRWPEFHHQKALDSVFHVKRRAVLYACLYISQTPKSMLV
jgi:hypothetical protein